MTPQEINSIIAKSRGWKHDADHKNCGNVWWEPDKPYKGGWLGHKTPPDFYHDLNAIREAVLSLSNTKFHRWASELSLLVLGTKQKAPTRQFLCASAAQWAEAYLKIL